MRTHAGLKKLTLESPRLRMAALTVCALVVAQCDVQSTPRPQAFGTGFYVWQRAWSESVTDSLRVAAPQAGKFMVLAAEMGAETISPDWGVLADMAIPVTLVIRVPASFARRITSDPAGRSATFLADTIRDARTRAEKHGVTVADVQLDYDCATSKLAQYRRLLNALKEELPHTCWSITVLPTWLRDDAFAPLASTVSYFVLQVHSLEKPTTVDAPMTLCDSAKLGAYLNAAGATGVPFYVALPTHGYHVAFDQDGRFVALSAEGPMPAWPPAYTVREVTADAKTMAAVVRGMRDSPPENCLGVVWFRLPVETDVLNWSWPTLHAVMEGRAPKIAYRAETRAPDPGLVEVWLANTGEDSATRFVAVDVRIKEHGLEAYDVLNRFRVIPSGKDDVVVLEGPAPKDSTPIMIAWYRMSDEKEARVVQAGPVEVVK
jgi:hypothetical protein